MEIEDLVPAELFCKHHNIEISFITSLSEFGLVEIIKVEQTSYISKEKMKDLEKMIRMHYELDINAEGIDAITHLLKKVDSMHAELTALKNRLRLYEE
jgi:hypothetical protein